VTLEISNTRHCRHASCEEGICQFLFLQGTAPPERAMPTAKEIYAPDGVTLPRL